MAEPWTEDNPGSVELGCMSTSTSNLSDASSKYWNASTALGTVQGTLTDWIGDAAVAWRSTVTALSTSILESRDRILEGSAAITAFRSTTLSISNRASTARHELESALAVWSVPQPNQITDPTGYADWENDRYRAQYREQEARNEIYRLALERYAADEDAIRGLTAALPDNWADTAAALASVGIGGVGDLTRGNNVDALLELSQRISAGNAEPGDYDALALMLGMYEHNESVMSDLFTALGGEGTVDLVEAIGDWGASGAFVAAAAVALGILVRSGLSTGSQNWTQPQADDFADSMFDAGPEKGDSIAYLFSDVVDSAMGQSLAIAAANQVDEFERLSGQTWLQDETGGGLWLAIQEFGDAGNRMSDASGPIFSTLGQYPDAAYEWLTDAGDGADRVQYWYHDRYDHMYWVAQGDDMPPYIFYAHDGFQGAADLWFGTQQAEGGPIFGGDGPATPEGAADLSSRIIQALTTSERFSADNVSDAATASLAAGFIANLPGLSQYPINADYPGELSMGAALAPDGTWTPVLTDDQLAVFLARAGSGESGAQILSFGISSYQETLLNMAITSGNPNDLNLALDRIVDLQAALEGSTQGQTIETAQGVDADREAVVSGISLVLGAMPVPGIGDAVAGGVGWVLNWGQGIAIGAVVEGVSTGVSDMWATQTEQALAHFAETREGSSEETFRVAMATSLYQYFEHVDPTVLAGIDPPTGDLDEWYAQNAPDLQANVGNWNPAGYPDSAFQGNVIDQLAQDYDGGVGDWVGRVTNYAGVVEYEVP